MDIKQALDLLIKEAPRHVGGILTYQLYPLLDMDLDDVTRTEVWKTVKYFNQQESDIKQAVGMVKHALQAGTLKIEENLSTSDKV